MIRIICLGKLKEQYLIDMVNDYKTRISKYHKIEIIELKDENDLEKEALEIEKYLNKNNYLIGLDINGQKYDSISLSKKIENIFINGYGNIDFIIGSSFGISDLIKNKTNLLLSFSDLTFPHGLFRALLLEQIYRSFKIINNETYHK